MCAGSPLLDSALEFLLLSKPNKTPIETKYLPLDNLNGVGPRMAGVDQVVHLPRQNGRRDRQHR
jgi:hypothetical protein